MSETLRRPSLSSSSLWTILYDLVCAAPVLGILLSLSKWLLVAWLRLARPSILCPPLTLVCCLGIAWTFALTGSPSSLLFLRCEGDGRHIVWKMEFWIKELILFSILSIGGLIYSSSLHRFVFSLFLLTSFLLLHLPSCFLNLSSLSSWSLRDETLVWSSKSGF